MELPEFKLCLLGSAGVGKTCVARRFARGDFDAAQPSSSAAAFARRLLAVRGAAARLQLWDTAGQEAFRALAPMYYRGAAAVLVVFDLTRPRTLEDARYWLDELRARADEGVLVYLVGNKADLEPQVAAAEAADFAARRECRYFSCSAATGEGVDAVFEAAAEELLARGEELRRPELVPRERARRCC